MIHPAHMDVGWKTSFWLIQTKNEEESKRKKKEKKYRKILFVNKVLNEHRLVNNTKRIKRKQESMQKLHQQQQKEIFRERKKTVYVAFKTEVLAFHLF